MTRLLRRGSWTATTIVLALSAVILVPGAGWAQDGVTATSPTDLTALAQAPNEVVLAFSATPDPALSHVATWDSAGSSVNTGTLTRDSSRRLRQSVAITDSGNYTVAYHVVFTDGADLIGSLRFSVGTGVAPPVPDAATLQADLAAVQEHHRIDPVSAVLLIVDGIVLLGAVMLLLRRRPEPPP